MRGTRRRLRSSRRSGSSPSAPSLVADPPSWPSFSGRWPIPSCSSSPCGLRNTPPALTTRTAWWTTSTTFSTARTNRTSRTGFERRICSSGTSTQTSGTARGAGCRDALDVRQMCERSDVRVMKIIRTRLAFLEPLMSDSEINFKVIFLTRDPRGSLNSIRKFGWNRDPMTRCSHLDKDQIAYDELSELYPDKVTLVKHEDFCLDPMGKAEELMEFLYGHSTVPEELKTYLMNHMTTKTQKGTMSTVKNSSQEYDAWRYKIREDDLLNIENEPVCVRTIENMGHVLFGSIQKANDSSVPLFVQ
ncbi:carbohydrate sulfotransferase 1-like [Penaeus chinensis]|uniref:carbohydrate sulfotransferase 1-like n=1 Tax=Penaeus chinensis TaxID=139456 RepID=UPI001FB698E0|nr:carbohydrate sulfotransferase 1-like [Penaeus chinensis]